jgi:hypothetical protein
MNLIFSHLEPKDVVTISISGIAFLLALGTFFFNVFHKYRDNQRAIRKEVTDVIKELVEVNLSFAKLNNELIGKPINNFLIDQRRAYNSRRRYLIEHGVFLIRKVPRLVSDIDYVILANACMHNGFLERSEDFWLKAIGKSITHYSKALNLRGHAQFQFHSGNPEKGRALYNESIDTIENDPSDINLETISDTILFWAKMEYDNNEQQKASDLFQQSIVYANRIINNSRRSNMLNVLKANNYLEVKTGDTAS